MKKTVIVFAACMLLASCASTSKAHVIQASNSAEEIRLTPGMATQIELPEGGHVQSVVTGNPALVTAERSYNVINLIPKTGTGETNLIARYIDDDGDLKVYQYRLSVQDR